MMESEGEGPDSAQCRIPDVSCTVGDECSPEVPKCHTMEQLQEDISHVTLEGSDEQDMRHQNSLGATADVDSAAAASLEPRNWVPNMSTKEVMLGRICKQ